MAVACGGHSDDGVVVSIMTMSVVAASMFNHSYVADDMDSFRLLDGECGDDADIVFVVDFDNDEGDD